MSRKVIFFILGTISLVISLVWGFTQDQSLEPWTVALGAVLFLLGIFFNDKPDSSAENQGDIKQSGFFSFFNRSSVRKHKGKARQWNWFSLGNTQEIDNSEESDSGQSGAG